jgi:hypothetical protein
LRQAIEQAERLPVQRDRLRAGMKTLRPVRRLRRVLQRLVPVFGQAPVLCENGRLFVERTTFELEVLRQPAMQGPSLLDDTPPPGLARA